MYEEIQVEDYMSTMQAIARKFSESSVFEYEELLSMAYLAFVDAEITYDPVKGKFTPYLNTCICNALRLAIKQWQGTADRTETYVRPSNDPADALIFKETLRGMSAEAREICALIFDSPLDFLEHSPRITRGQLRDKLREMGWSWSRIWNGMREVKTTLQVA